MDTIETLSVNDGGTNAPDDSGGYWMPASIYSSDFREATHKSLDRISSLKQNWDCGGAHPIDLRILAAAKSLVNALPDGLVGPPLVAPISRGSLQFEWQEGDRSLEIEFEGPDSLRYLKWDPNEEIEEEASLPAGDIPQIEALLYWLIGSSHYVD